MINKIVYIDISQFLAYRKLTGIQRVIIESVSRLIKDTIDGLEIKVIYYQNDSYYYMKNKEVLKFFRDIDNYKFKKYYKFNIYKVNNVEKILLELDAVWNSNLKRETLYPKLKKQGFKIYNFIYDLIPILFPEYMRDNTKNNFRFFLDVVSKYSDLIFFDSNSSKNDFTQLIEIKSRKKVEKKVLYLGSDFKCKDIDSKKYQKLLSKRFILFVGTIEPRKEHSIVLESFEELYKEYEDLNLVFIGSIGWKMNKFIQKLTANPLKNISIFHFQDLNNNELSLFYKNAYIVAYLSKYEGYGLPIAESLSYGNITIVSKNSSMPEVGKKCADYLDVNKSSKLTKIIKYYLENKKHYKSRVEYITNNYRKIYWNDFYKLLKKSLL